MSRKQFFILLTFLATTILSAQDLRTPEYDVAEIGIHVSSISSPYAVNLGVAGIYKNYTLKPPFYFGGGIEPSIAFPTKNFTYIYEENNTILKNPLLLGTKFDFPVGIYTYPFEQDIPFFAEISAGISLWSLWNQQFGKKGLFLTPKAAFETSLKVGIDYNQFKIAVNANFDTILKFSVGIFASFSINLPIINSEIATQYE